MKSIKKKCTICGQEKPIDEFYKQPRNRDGYQNQCKQCNKIRHKEYIKKYIDENRDKINKKNREYNRLNKDKKAESNRKYREKNKEKIHIYNINYRKNNIEKVKEIDRRYNRENKDVIKSMYKDYRSKYKNRGSARKKSDNVEIQNCVCCGSNKNINRHHFDYDRPECVVFLCSSCHRGVHSYINKKSPWYQDLYNNAMSYYQDMYEGINQ